MITIHPIPCKRAPVWLGPAPSPSPVPPYTPSPPQAPPPPPAPNLPPPEVEDPPPDEIKIPVHEPPSMPTPMAFGNITTH